MNSPQLYDLCIQAVTVVFLLGLPVIISAMLSGTIISALQAATSIQEPALGYAVRLLVVAGVLYLMLPAIIRNLINLFESVLT